MDLNNRIFEIEQLVEKLNDQTIKINKKHQEQLNDKQVY
jgi:hypothetical protein